MNVGALQDLRLGKCLDLTRHLSPHRQKREHDADHYSHHDHQDNSEHNEGCQQAGLNLIHISPHWQELKRGGIALQLLPSFMLSA